MQPLTSSVSAPRRLFAAASVLVSLAAALTGRAGFVLNPSFEENYNPTFPSYSSIDQWAGDGGRGVNEANGPFHNGGTPIPDGFRVGFLQGNNNLTQEIFGLEAGKQYWIQFSYDARACCGGTIDLAVSFAGIELAKIVNVTPVTGGETYRTRTVPFTPEFDSGTLQFTTSAAGDATANIDAVSIVQRDPGSVPVANPSFEASGTPLGDGILPALAGWQGDGFFGVNLGGSGEFADNGETPDQDHVGFITGSGRLSQIVRGLVVGESYELTVAYNAQAGTQPHIQIIVAGTTVFEEDVTAVGADNPYLTRSVTFTAATSDVEIAIAQTEGGVETLLLDDVRLAGVVQEPLPCLALEPPLSLVRPGGRATISVTVDERRLAEGPATVQLRSPNPAVAAIVGADLDGVITLDFPADAPTTTQTFEVEGAARGTLSLEVVNDAGLCVESVLRVDVTESFVLNPSFEANAAPAGVGYGAITAWNGGSGINTEFMPFLDNGLLPDRAQVAFIQGSANLNQEVSGLQSGEGYWLQFRYNARACCGGTIDLNVRLGGEVLATITDVQPVGAGVDFHFANIPFVPMESAGLLEFETVANGDATVLLDAVSIVRRAADEIVVQNPSFEATGRPVGVGYLAPGRVAGWEITGGYGINIDQAGPFTDNGVTSDQDTVLLLQNAGSATQLVSGLEVGRNYTLTYSVNIRNCCDPGGFNESSYAVSVDGVPVFDEAIQPAGVGVPYYEREVTFTAENPDVFLTFEHVPLGDDRTLLLDDIRIIGGGGGPGPQSPGLRITLIAGNSVLLTWSSNFADYVLQSSPTMAEDSWTDVSTPPFIDGDEVIVAEPITADNLIYRLVPPAD